MARRVCAEAEAVATVRRSQTTRQTDKLHPALYLDGIVALLVHALLASKCPDKHEHNLNAWPSLKRLVEEELPTELVPLLFRCGPELDQPSKIWKLVHELSAGTSGWRGDQMPANLVLNRPTTSQQFHLAFYSLNMLDWEVPENRSSRIPKTLRTRATFQSPDQTILAVRPEVVIVSTLQQLLRAQEAHQRNPNLQHQMREQVLRRAFFALRTIGAIIRDDIRKQVAEDNKTNKRFFNPKDWMYAVLLSAGPPPHYEQARPLYDAPTLKQLLLLLGQVPEHDDSLISFFRGLLQDTLSLHTSGYQPRNTLQAQLSFPRADKVLHRWATHQESVRASPKLSHRLSDAADKPSSDGWKDEDSETLQIARVRTAPEVSSLHQDGDGPTSFVPAQRSRFNLRGAAAGLFKTSRRTFTD
ncbi:hypothetical protein C6P46_000988 [Rhodotorula mucilaginosa]|uniref:Uncharacterized protein n=1 Tax=Rhodotorula mucilaginosa TaxID=5537 RepID=A0A9P6VTQ4_RHOMI|nr:hypothetical protein C6P46_000988 [Rhodotorula mucilaginosa]